MKTFLSVLSFLLCFAASNVVAVTYYVDETNGDDSNDGLSAQSPLQFIRTAANMTGPGDTVKILPGVYRDMGASNAFDGVYVPNSGRAGAYITYSGVLDADGNRPVIESSGLTAFTMQTKSYIIVENLEFVGAEEDYLDLRGSIGDWAWDNRSGIGVQRDSYNIIIRNNYIHDFPGGGIGISGADVVLVENNLVEHTSWGSTQGNSGISFYKMTEQENAVRFPEYPDHDVVIRNNLSRYNANLKGTAAFDYKLTDGNGIIVDDFKHTQGDEANAFLGSSLILENISYGNGAAGINVFQVENVDVLNNTVFDNGHSRRTTGDPQFELNHAHQPIQVGGSKNTFVANNILVRGDNGTSMASLFWNEDATITFDNNIFWNADGSITSGNIPGGNNTIADPLFASAQALSQAQTDLLATASWDETTPSATLREVTKDNGFPIHDFTLLAGSPAIDAGSDFGWSSFEGDAPDIGAVEGQADVTLTNDLVEVSAAS